MTEQQIRETASLLVDKVKEISGAKGEPSDADQLAVIVWGTNLAVQVLVDINRCAAALEQIAKNGK